MQLAENAHSDYPYFSITVCEVHWPSYLNESVFCQLIMKWEIRRDIPANVLCTALKKIICKVVYGLQIKYVYGRM
jgi:hypothetical protein